MLPITWHIVCCCVQEKDSIDHETQCAFKADEYGFFIYWKSEAREGDVIELCQVSDIRAGGVPKDQRLYNQLTNRHGENLEDKSLTICSGYDYVNVTYQHIVCPDPETAKVKLFIYYDIDLIFCEFHRFGSTVSGPSRTMSKLTMLARWRV